MGSNTHVPSQGASSIARRDQIALAALADIPPDASMEMKVAAMEALAAKLQALVDLERWDRWDPKKLTSVALKRNYREVELIDVGSGVRSLQVLPDSSIISGDEDGRVCIWTKGIDGTWGREELRGHTEVVLCHQALPDGRIVSGGGDNTIRVWTKVADGNWSSDELRGHDSNVWCLQVLPDGRIVSGSSDGTIRSWTKSPDGAWSHEKVVHYGDLFKCLDVFPDGKIVSGTENGKCCIFSPGSDAAWRGEEKHATRFGPVLCIQALPDGRFVSGSGIANCELLLWTKGLLGVWSSQTVGQHNGAVLCLQALSGGRIVSGGCDHVLRIWSKPNAFLNRLAWISGNKHGNCEVLSGHDNSVTCLQALPDGRIVSGSRDGTIRIWDGEEIAGGAS